MTTLDLNQFKNPTPSGSLDLNQFKLNPTPQTNHLNGFSVLDNTNASKASFPTTGNESMLGGAAATVGNIPSSAIGFGKGLIDFFNPVNTADTLSNLGSSILGGAKEGVSGWNVAKEIPGQAYKMVVPQFLQHLFSGDIQSARATIQNDPVGQIAPIILMAKGAAEKAGVGPQFDSAISKMASPVISTAEGAANIVGKSIGATAKFGVSQTTGLSPETISKITSDPQAFTKEAQSQLSRPALASQIESALSQRESNLGETGSSYQPIREGATPVTVSPNWLLETIQKNTGLGVDANGKLITSADSSLSQADANAFQSKIIDKYQSEFDNGTLDSNQLLNLRSDLANLSNYENGFRKNTTVENAANGIRRAVNTDFRPQVPGLENLDKSFAEQTKQYADLRKGLIDSNGNLTDSAINKIANATGKGKDLLASRLEQIVPGITAKIGTLKAVEDIQNAGGQKVGTYVRAGGLVGGIATFNPYLIVGSILSIPDIAVPILRGIGMSEPLISATIKNLGIAGKAVNNLPSIVQKNLSQDVQNIKPGLTIEDITKNGGVGSPESLPGKEPLKQAKTSSSPNPTTEPPISSSPRKIPVKIAQDANVFTPDIEKNLTDFIDYARGVKKVSKAEGLQLEQDASRFAEDNGLELPKTHAKLADVIENFIAKNKKTK